MRAGQGRARGAGRTAGFGQGARGAGRREGAVRSRSSAPCAHGPATIRRAVDQLLRRGADPNLVLEDGAAAVHLAARARRPRPLRCLTALLRAGGDPNAR